jgi:hypothetical protein
MTKKADADENGRPSRKKNKPKRYVSDESHNFQIKLRESQRKLEEIETKLKRSEALRVEAEIDVARNKRCSAEWEKLYVEIYGRLLCFIHTV